MESNDAADLAIKNAVASGKPIVLLFTGLNCKWCDKLKTALGDQVLQRYCADNNVALEWILLGAKADEAAQACDGGACRVPTRTRFGIQTIPTAVVVGVDGEAIASTQFIDEVVTVGGLAYVEWATPFLAAAAVSDDEL